MLFLLNEECYCMQLLLKYDIFRGACMYLSSFKLAKDLTNPASECWATLEVVTQVYSARRLAVIAVVAVAGVVVVDLIFPLPVG